MAEKNKVVFRVLRADENVQKLVPKQKNLKREKDMEKFTKTLVLEHIRFGSKKDYKSSLISFTAELNVALAFSGIVSRVAVTNLQEKIDDEVIELDKEYLRHFLSDSDAKARSRRSDEVLVFGEITEAQELPIEIKNCERILTPGFEKEDEEFFPNFSVDDFKNMKTIKSLSGPNQRLFQLEIAGKIWTARCPRPNYRYSQ